MKETRRHMVVVVSVVNAPRTQNGHIRNDTRDVSRRISTACNGPIYRRKCVASNRACTRVTPGNLHGKEAVPGSSPGEGLNTCKTGFFETTESLLNKEGWRGESGQTPEKSLQIRRVCRPIEHLLAREGVA
jgi:hypothetical protein